MLKVPVIINAGQKPIVLYRIINKIIKTTETINCRRAID